MELKGKEVSEGLELRMLNDCDLFVHKGFLYVLAGINNQDRQKVNVCSVGSGLIKTLENTTTVKQVKKLHYEY